MLDGARQRLGNCGGTQSFHFNSFFELLFVTQSSQGFLKQKGSQLWTSPSRALPATDNTLSECEL